jgi:hypothetical protein
MKDLLSKTIWAKGAIPASERKYATPLKRFVLPAFDFVCFVSGLFAVYGGIPAFEQALSPHTADILGYLFAITAASCFVGIAFPNLRRVELGSKIALFSLMGMYSFCLAFLGDAGGSSRYFAAGIVAAATLIPLFRLWILGVEIGDRHLAAHDAEVG